MSMVELFEELVDEKAFKKVVSIDRRIEMRSKSGLSAIRDLAKRIALTNRMN
jgi:hypothetical protein